MAVVVVLLCCGCCAVVQVEEDGPRNLPQSLINSELTCPICLSIMSSTHIVMEVRQSSDLCPLCLLCCLPIAPTTDC